VATTQNGTSNIRVVEAGSQDRSRDELVVKVHDRILKDLDVRALDALSYEESHEHVRSAVTEVLGELAGNIAGVIKQEVITAVVDEVLGYGPIQPLLDARLPDGSRVNIVIPPIAVNSPTLTIRKFQTDRFDFDDLIRIGSVTEQAAGFLRACVAAKLNIVISGGTGSGKTTLMNALSGFIPAQERVVTIEDPVEIQLRQPHVVTLEARPGGQEGAGQISQRELVKNSLRMRPDRIIVGEVRGDEAFDMMQAMNTGHEGSITTVHANTTRDALSRIENMVMLAGFELPTKAIREQMASALHLIVQVSRMIDGTRRVTALTEVAGMEGEVIALQDIFRFEQAGLDDDGRVRGDLKATGIRPHFTERFEHYGVSEAWVRPPDAPAATAALR
jgi:pilus assembly protein CpaF